MIHMFEIIGALPETDVVDDQFQITLHGLPDGFEVLKFPVDMFINDDLFHAHVFILEGLSDRVDPGYCGDLDLETWEAFSHQIDKVGNPDGDRISPRFVNPFDELDQLSIAFSGILEISEAGSIEEITELQAFFMTGVDITLDVIAIDLGQDKARPCSSHDVEGKLAKEGIDRGSLEGIDQGKIPV